MSESNSHHARFERLVRDHQAAVFRSAHRVVRDDATALDVAQQVFLRVLQGKLDAVAADDARGVLCWTATKLALNQRRDADSRRRHERLTEEPTMSSPDSEISRRDEQRIVRNVVDEMPDELRLPLVLRFEEGLTFAAVGSALDCSESTAHDRVRRALDSLRAKLRGLGFAAVALRLPERLAELEPPAVPAGVEAALLEIGAKSAATSWFGGVGLAKSIALFVASALVAVAAFESASMFGSPELEPVVRSGAAADGTGATDAAAPDRSTRGAAADREVVGVDVGADAGDVAHAPAQDPAERVAWVEGRVVDDAGRDVEAARVSIYRGPWRTKGSRPVTVVESDPTGRFRASVPLDTADPIAAEVVVTKRAYDLVEVDVAELRPRVTTFVDVAPLSRWTEDRPGSYELLVAIVDADGRPVEGARVEVYRRRKGESVTFGALREGAGRTDAAGCITLTGERIGEKVVEVRAMHAGFRFRAEEFAVTSSGRFERRVVVEPGRVVTGRVRTLDGAPVPARYSLDLAREVGSTERFTAYVDAGGEFTFRGLGDRDYVLMSRDSRFSVFTRTIAAGTQDLDVVLKRRDDTTPGAWHDAEIHGVVRDAATGELLACGPFDVMARELWAADERATDADLRLEAWKPWLVQLSAGPEHDRLRDSFAETGLDAGTYVLFTEIRGYAPSYVGPFRLEGRELIDDLVVDVYRGATVRGHVRDAGGEPVPGAFVGLFGDVTYTEVDADLAALEAGIEERDGLRVGHRVHAVRTDEHGAFTFEHVPHGMRFRLGAVHTDWVAAAGPRLELRNGEIRDGLELRLMARR